MTEETCRKIKQVKDNKEKRNTYQNNFHRYNVAKKAGCYFECIWILYAVLEDRTADMLFYLGFTSVSDHGKVKGTKWVKKQIRQIFNMSKETDKYGFDSLSGKLSRLDELIKWSMAENEGLSEYQELVRKTVRKVMIGDEFRSALEYLNNKWRDKRNQLTHLLLNKDSDAVSAELLEMVDTGYKYIRVIDNATARMQRMKIREHYKIQ